MKVVAIFFSWTKQERIGVIILSVLLMLIFGIDIFFHRIYPFKDQAIHPDSLEAYKKLLDELENKVDTTQGFSFPVQEEKFIEKTESVLDFFDPNKLDVSAWQSLGFSPKQALALLKYKKLIGGFKEKEDVAKAYVVSEKKYRELEAFIRIEKIESVLLEDEDLSEPSLDMPPNNYVELNTADSLQLLALKGIGPFYASKIIAYRKELGAFVSIDQLLEIWKFDSLKLASLEGEIWVDTSRVIKLRINIDSTNALRKHPYLDWNHANAIVSYRNQHGPYTTKDDLKKIAIFSDSLMIKLYPYISLDK